MFNCGRTHRLAQQETAREVGRTQLRRDEHAGQVRFGPAPHVHFGKFDFYLA